MRSETGLHIDWNLDSWLVLQVRGKQKLNCKKEHFGYKLQITD